MQITKIEIQKRNPNRRSIYVDGKFVAGVDMEVIISHRLKEGMEITKSELERIIYGESKRKGKEYALNLLSYRARSSKEIKDRLKKKGYEQRCISEVMDELEKVGLVNDIEFARTWIRERGKSRGTFKLISELTTKGIAKEVIDEVLLERKTTDTEVAQNLTKHWIKSHKYLDEKILKRRLFNFLLRRGISYDTIKELDIFNR
ncbi:MAG: RecX family transcriptional regulator [bacterium]|nr:RecX family transcriptional regulator [bacterium]